MRADSRTRLGFRLQTAAFVVLFLGVIGLLGALSVRYDLQIDWTASGRNTLSEASRQLLDRLAGPVQVTAFVTQDEVLRTQIKELVDRYRRYKGDLSLEFVNPEEAPERARAQKIRVDGEMLVQYEGRSEHVQQHSERALTNALQRLVRTGERWITFITGHGERDPNGKANFDLGNWGRQLEDRGVHVRTVNLAQTGAVPDNTDVVVIADPQTDLLPAEVELLTNYVAGGGNLLWLRDPGPAHGLDPLAGALGLSVDPGVIVDPTLQAFGVRNPTFVPVTDYPDHPVTQNFGLLTLFPRAAALEEKAPEGWKSRNLLETGAAAWAETGELKGEIRFDPGQDTEGPLTIGVVLSRHPEAAGDAQPEAAGAAAKAPAPGREQRVVIIGDSDFLANAYLGNGGNLDLGMNLVNWLSSDEKLLDIPAHTAPDLSFNPTLTAKVIIAAVTLFGLPPLLLASGFVIWFRRRRR